MRTRTLDQPMSGQRATTSAELPELQSSTRAIDSSRSADSEPDVTAFAEAMVRQWNQNNHSMKKSLIRQPPESNRISKDPTIGPVHRSHLGENSPLIPASQRWRRRLG